MAIMLLIATCKDTNTITLADNIIQCTSVITSHNDISKLHVKPRDLVLITWASLKVTNLIRSVLRLRSTV